MIFHLAERNENGVYENVYGLTQNIRKKLPAFSVNFMFSWSSLVVLDWSEFLVGGSMIVAQLGEELEVWNVKCLWF